MKLLKQHALLLLVVLVFVPGCSLMKQAKDKVGLAREKVEFLEAVKADELYPDDFGEAKGSLDSAEDYLKSYKLNKALADAEKSLNISDRMQGQYEAQVNVKVNLARNHIESLEKIKANELYPDDFGKARQLLTSADEHLKSNRPGDALESAEKSLDASQRVQDLHYAYIAGFAKKSIALIKKKTESINNEGETVIDTDNPIREDLPKLENMLKNFEKMKSKEMIASIDVVVDDYQEVLQIMNRAESSETMQLESDISFGAGKYDLSYEGKQRLGIFFEKIKENIDKYSGSIVKINIRTVGYTDGLGFQAGTKLVRALINGKEDEVPRDRIERRKFLNQRLSEFRASSIGRHFREIAEDVQGNARVDFDFEEVGRGENFPPGIEYVDHPEDRKRRICKVYINLRATSEQ